METQERQTHYRVHGMDCAGCTAKIDGAVRRAPGVKEVNISLAGRSMTVRHSASIDPKMLERRVRALGYRTERLPAADDAAGTPQEGCCGHGQGSCDHADDPPAHAGRDLGHAVADKRAGEANEASLPDFGPAWNAWYRNPRIALTVASGLALGAAFALERLFPAYAFWFFAAAMMVGLVPVGRRALAGLFLARTPFSIEMLMTVAATGAVAVGATHEAAVVVLLFLVGELLEGVAAGRARSAIAALGELVPKTALLEEDGALREVPAGSLRRGANVLVRSGERVPADGIVLGGESAVDEAPVTGESIPVHKRAGDTVFAGTVNGEAALRVKVTAAAEDNTIARIVRLVEEAQEAKAPTERFIDRFSRYYMPGVVAVAALVAVVPPALYGAAWSEWTYRGLALLLIGCPCALVISTPAAIAAALAAGARRGLLVKGGAVLERLGGVSVAAFDKTGTLTAGRPQVTDVVAFGEDEGKAEIVRLAAALERGASHPLARAVLARAAEMSLDLPAAADTVSLAGKGISGRVEGRDLLLCSLDAAPAQARIPDEAERQLHDLREEGRTLSVLIADGTAIGALAMRDTPRSDAAAALRRLSGQGLQTLMLTGDNARTARAIGRELGIEVRAGLLPEDKQRIVRELQAQNQRVAKIGDGINDAPALAAADVGIAMGGGTDVALETGDAASLHGRIDDIAEMIALSRRTMTNIRQNVAIALGFKAVFLVTTIAGLTGLWPAIMADTGATVLVTANALRLLGVRDIRTARSAPRTAVAA